MNMRSLLFAAGSAALLASCATQYTGMMLRDDDLTDEENMAYAAQAQKAYEARMKAPPRPVVITEAPSMSFFLEPKSKLTGHRLCNDLGVRKEVAVASKGYLRDKVSSIKDFKLQDEAQAMVAVGDELAPSSNYRMTYSITSLALRKNSIGSRAINMVGSFVEGDVEAQGGWDGVATVEIRLFKPDGVTSIFSFTGKGVYNKLGEQVDVTYLTEAVKLAIDDAMDQYIMKYGPPTFVTETCQGGAFARLNMGALLGVQPGMKVEFYQNKVRKGLSGEDEVFKRTVARGTVAENGAPVEPDGAWVFIDEFNPEHRAVFRWTSARILRDLAH